MKRTRGFTLVELLVVIAIIALLISLLLPALGKAISNAKTLKDATQMNQIHKAMLSFAVENKGKFPIPGLINRLEDPNIGGGTEVPGSGPEDFSKNTSVGFYSSMIAQRRFQPEILIGPTEVRRIVRVCDNYDYDMYDVADDTYWDGDGQVGNFRVNVQTSDNSTDNWSNTSYSHMAIVGQRKKEKWRDTGTAGDPVLGTRGTRNGVGPGDQSYDKSPTLHLHGDTKVWNGNVCFNDNHTEYLNNFYPPLTNYEDGFDPPQKDNIFVPEFGGGNLIANQLEADAFLVLAHTANANGQSLTLAIDALLPN